MKCPCCKSKLKVIDSRIYGDKRMRKYKCVNPKCKFSDVTEEKLPGNNGVNNEGI